MPQNPMSMWRNIKMTSIPVIKVLEREKSEKKKKESEKSGKRHDDIKQRITDNLFVCEKHLKFKIPSSIPQKKIMKKTITWHAKAKLLSTQN
jgi:hypothetical protein